jgi:multicomponent Na+:H+ antiporter subunit D
VLPVVVACLLLVGGHCCPRHVIDLAALITAAGMVVLTAVLLHRALSGRVVTWVGGWTPRGGFSVGVVFVADPVGAGAALVAAVLLFAALLFGWRYFDSADAHYHCLMLLFGAGMVGFALSGDLFDMFVFFEVMGAAAYALTAFRVEEATAVQGALNFALVNSLGAYVTLMGIGLLYARTGNLTLPQLHDALAGQHDRLVVAGFLAVLTGFLVKAALVPFHFWLADAHAVAPTPVCVLFSGIMVPLGLYAVFRVYWLVFSPALPAADVRRLFLVLGALTAVLGAVMCVGQTHLKRLLAYSTIAHIGLFTVAAGCLTAAGTAGALLYALGHASVKSALFLNAGTTLNRLGGVDEVELFARGKGLNSVRWLMLGGALALAGLPPFATGLGKAVCEEAGTAAGYWWLPPLFVVVSGCTGGAVLRAAGRIFFGLGVRPSGGSPVRRVGAEQPELPLPRTRVTMLVPVLALLCAALVGGLLPGAHAAAARAASWFIDADGYRRAALTGVAVFPSGEHPGNWTMSGVLLGLLSAALAAVVALAAWYGPRWPALTGMARAGRAPMDALRRVHSGRVGDYVAWLVAGVAAGALLMGFPSR